MTKEELYVMASFTSLELNEAEAEKLNQAINRMIDYLSIMDKADVDGLEPAIHIAVKESRTREDVPAPLEFSIADKLIENAPEKEGRFVVVPNVL
jgi:aspartyl/glutamyl-tRNA(Asn/Gln) amidotransferase C subunit